jgi:hypothetical protein
MLHTFTMIPSSEPNTHQFLCDGVYWGKLVKTQDGMRAESRDTDPEKFTAFWDWIVKRLTLPH